MIDYIEQALGIAEGSLHNDVGAFFCVLILTIAFFAICKLIIIWIQDFFGGS